MSKIDNEVLIQAIRAQPQLWDTRLKSYSNKSEKQIGWQEVADDVGSTVTDCKSRWKTLRDSFIRQLRNLRRQGVPDDSLTSQWVHFHDMLFLKDVCTTHKSILYSQDESNDSEAKSHSSSSQLNSTRNSTRVKSEIKYNDDEEGESFEDQIDELPSAVRKRIKLTPPKVIQTSSDPLRISISELEKKKLEILQKDNINSADYHFLMSLLPTLEKLPKEKKMLIKVQMLSMLYEATYGQPMPSNNLNRPFKSISSVQTNLEDFDDSISTCVMKTQ